MIQKGKQFVDTGKQTVNKYKTGFFVHFVRQLNDSILSTIGERVILNDKRSKLKNEKFFTSRYYRSEFSNIQFNIEVFFSPMFLFIKFFKHLGISLCSCIHKK